MSAMAGSLFAAVSNVPDVQEPSSLRKAPSDRGKNSYHEP
jgi:hypothetical protein